MKNIFCTFFATLVLVFGSLSASAAEVIFGGPADPLDSTSGPWAWSGDYLIALRGEIENPANFGPGSPVELTVDTVEVSSTDAATLAGIDVFVSSWWYESQSAAHETNVINWFLSGGSLLLLQDGPGQDGIGQALGIPTTQSTGTPSTGDGLLFEGPFGSGDGSIQSAIIGQINAADVITNGGTIDGTNAEGQVTAAYWCPGDYAEGAGGMVILPDVDMVSTGYDSTRYNPLNANGKLGLNTAAFLAERCDDDGDGVLNDDDFCPDTSTPEGVPTVKLGVNRHALADGSQSFSTTAPQGKGPGRSYSTTDTAGCSCEQIIEAQGLGKGHTKFGCSISAMDDWVELVTP
jgi:hypothetical protein